MGNIHIGQEIKEQVQEQNVTVEELAGKLQIAASEVEQIFEKPSIDTDLLYQISTALNYNFFTPFSRKLNERYADETIALLKERGDKCFVSYHEIEEDTPWIEGSIWGDDSTQSLYLIGVGLDEDGELTIHACSPEDDCERWIRLKYVLMSDYQTIYDFVVAHPELAMTEEEASEITL